MGDDKKAALFGDDEDQKMKKDEEEGKVEKFFELIRNLREARNRLIMGPEMAETTNIVNEEKVLVVSEESETKTKKKKRKRMDVINWVPSFEEEDFTADVKFRGTPSIYPVPCNCTRDTDKPHVKDGNLNLDLTL